LPRNSWFRRKPVGRHFETPAELAGAQLHSLAWQEHEPAAANRFDSTGSFCYRDQNDITVNSTGKLPLPIDSIARLFVVRAGFG
jgi:hypothetical protein